MVVQCLIGLCGRYIYIWCILDRLNVDGTFDQAMDVHGYVILFEL
jgi:hypothetical protein